MNGMRGKTTHVTVALLALLASPTAAADVELRSPGFPPSKVAGDGSLVEPWGTVRLRIVEPPGATVTDHRTGPGPMPMALTCLRAGPLRLTQTAYRSPIWPSGVDVLEVRLRNTAQTPVRAELELVVPAEMEFGEWRGVLRGRLLLALPADLQAVRRQREWGCTGGVVAMPGWAKPSRQCDPAFRNISAGMGGVPITYRFAVEPGAKRTVVLGFCESFHPSAGIRPVLTQVEGAATRSVDPIQSWGRHVPGVERFPARDADDDGRLEVTVAPHPRASDRNPILNVIWIFRPDVPIDEEALILGRMNDQAERYVDVGGKNDQTLYEPGNLKYVFQLQPEEQREFFFLVASPGCQTVPDPSLGLWDKATLRKAAAEVWRDRWEEAVSPPGR
ncbi:MAG TPA: hypothetical protein EYP56_10980 [Planctomycetaceae bacterium]|nr:hypothetical protein [Planctomycetaceae bacterium]